MLTVPEAAKRIGRNPETVRRWIREGKLPARKVGTQHVIEEEDLGAAIDEPETLPLPEEWRTLDDGSPAPNWVALVREARRGRR